jgi:hypothetical protein
MFDLLARKLRLPAPSPLAAASWAASCRRKACVELAASRRASSASLRARTASCSARRAAAARSPAARRSRSTRARSCCAGAVCACRTAVAASSACRSALSRARSATSATCAERWAACSARWRTSSASAASRCPVLLLALGRRQLGAERLGLAQRPLNRGLLLSHPRSRRRCLVACPFGFGLDPHQARGKLTHLLLLLLPHPRAWRAGSPRPGLVSPDPPGAAPARRLAVPAATPRARRRPATRSWHWSGPARQACRLTAQPRALAPRHGGLAAQDFELLLRPLLIL